MCSLHLTTPHAQNEKHMKLELRRVCFTLSYTRIRMAGAHQTFAMNRCEARKRTKRPDGNEEKARENERVEKLVVNHIKEA